MGATEKTQHLELGESDIALALAKQTGGKGTTKNLGKPKEILLMGETALRRLELYAHQNNYILGRFSDSDRYTNYVDLSPFGGQELGVSRTHAQIQMEGDKIYLTDLASRNGTYLGGLRLEANQPVSLQSGASIIFGRLHLQLVIKFKESLESAM